MDINDWRALVTLVSLVLFVVMVAWIWRRDRKGALERAAAIALSDDPPPGLKRHDGDIR